MKILHYIIKIFFLLFLILNSSFAYHLNANNCLSTTTTLKNEIVFNPRKYSLQKIDKAKPQYTYFNQEYTKGLNLLPSNIKEFIEEFEYNAIHASILGLEPIAALPAEKKEIAKKKFWKNFDDSKIIISKKIEVIHIDNNTEGLVFTFTQPTTRSDSWIRLWSSYQGYFNQGLAYLKKETKVNKRTEFENWGTGLELFGMLAGDFTIILEYTRKANKPHSVTTRLTLLYTADENFPQIEDIIGYSIIQLSS